MHEIRINWCKQESVLIKTILYPFTFKPKELPRVYETLDYIKQLEKFSKEIVKSVDAGIELSDHLGIKHILDKKMQDLKHKIGKYQENLKQAASKITEADK